MVQIRSTHAINRRALLAFTTVLAALVVAVALVVVALQRQQLLSAEQEELETEMLLLGELATESLLRSDYAAVEGLVQRWLDRHDYLSALKAVMPNGFVLVERRKAAPARTPLDVTHAVTFDGRVLMTLHAVGDFSEQDDDFAGIVTQVVVVAVTLILLLSWALWWTLKRTALQPLEMQIIRREEKERELLNRTAELEAALMELESFSYSVSHDLRSPLRAIDGFSHALAEDYGQLLDAAGHDHLARIRAASQRMGVLIDDLLALSRMTRRDLVVEDIDLSALARQVLAQLAQADPGRQVQIEIVDGMRGRGDPSLIAVVLDNLLGNAWKFTARSTPARIRFDATAHDGRVAYCVHDNGAGVDMTYADKLFRPFQRLHPAQDFPGSGVGLATVARIVRRHGGRVWAQGEVGKGASFCFTLGT